MERLGAEYRLEMGKSTVGNAKRIINFISSFSKIVSETEENLQKSEQTLTDMKKALSSENDESENALRECEKEAEELRVLLIKDSDSQSASLK